VSAHLSFRQVSVEVSGRPALSGITLAVPGGEVTALLGANGAGKSTLLRCALGFVPAHTGSVVLGDSVLDGKSVEARVRAGLAWCPEGRRLFPAMSVEENLAVACPGGAEARRQGLAEMFARFPGLAEKRHAPAWQLSGGQQQMLALARAMIAKPKVLLLDEPSLGLAPAVLDDLSDLVRSIAASGTAVLLAEAHPAWALSCADTAAVLTRGELVATGAAADISGSKALTEGLLG
jgi:branched-chain amino acid transport system ATP-binding protein